MTTAAPPSATIASRTPRAMPDCRLPPGVRQRRGPASYWVWEFACIPARKRGTFSSTKAFGGWVELAELSALLEVSGSVSVARAMPAESWGLRGARWLLGDFDA